ncbi:hypothetical protein SAY87_020128 [Trapa incisa]|uniref:Tail-anchored protein insertion receptor WRB n=1 Tax=Trapa incisa TaxID=236973 RepID=A0AAN7K714_9MYRT|nr:hypothetical protein SAY87_020128 [Trapa incisa]
MEEETLNYRGSLAAPLIFIMVLVFHFISLRFEHSKKNASKNTTEVRLRGEIKKLLREASTLSQPSTFAQASKLRRQAAAKEKELAKIQESVGKEIQLSYDSYLKALFFAKVFTYIVLVFWFWRTPVASISQQLVQPFGKLLSWGAGGALSGNIMVGVIPWLILSTRVSKFVFRVFNW